MATKIVTKNSSTAASVPTAAQLVQGELAVNVADKRLYTEDNAGAIVELGTNPSTLTVTGEITANGGIALGDNDKATFGAGDDLSIYHNNLDGHSYIEEAGLGNLFIDASNLRLRDAAGANMLRATSADSVELYYNAALKLSTTATGIDVTGTVVADGLTVDDIISIDTSTGSAFSSTGNLKIDIDSDNDAIDRVFQITSDAEDKVLFQAEEGGDVSFYEDTGTTPKLFWDASAESLGIGTDSPTQLLTLSSADPRLNFIDTNSTANGATALIEFEGSNGRAGYAGMVSGDLFLHTDTLSAGDIVFRPNNSEAVRITSAGSVGIGTSSPSRQLTVQNSGNAIAAITSGTSSSSFLLMGDTDSDNIGMLKYNNADNSLGFYAGSNSSERMRIDASGLVSIKNLAAPTLRLENTDTSLSAEQVVGALEFFSSDPSGKGPNVTGYIETRAADSVGAGGEMVFATGAIGSSPEGERATERMRIDSSGHAIIPAGVTLGTATGVYAAANTLDDYEEGTWTPTISSGTHTYTTQVGKYTKVGNLVTVKGEITISSRGSSPAELGISGLPFGGSSPQTANFNWVSAYGVTGLFGLTVLPTGLSMEGSIAYVRRSGDSAVSYTINDLASSGSIRFSMVYYTA